MNNKIIKILIPIVAVVIIFESIFLVSSLKNNNDIVSDTKVEVEKTVEPLVSLNLSSEVEEMQVGESYEVALNFIPKEDLNLNSLELFVKYDKEIVTISDLVYNEEIPTPDFTKVSDKKDVIVSNFYFKDTKGIAFKKDNDVNVLTFSVTPIKAGETSFEISNGDSEGDSITIFIDKTKDVLPFTSNKLSIKLVD
jgi:hypothetical protein